MGPGDYQVLWPLSFLYLSAQGRLDRRRGSNAHGRGALSPKAQPRTGAVPDPCRGGGAHRPTLQRRSRNATRTRASVALCRLRHEVRPRAVRDPCADGGSHCPALFQTIAKSSANARRRGATWQSNNLRLHASFVAAHIS